MSNGIQGRAIFTPSVRTCVYVMMRKGDLKSFTALYLRSSALIMRSINEVIGSKRTVNKDNSTEKS